MSGWNASLEAGDYLRRLFDAFFHKPMNFSYVDDHVCGSARIMSKRDLEWLGAQGVHAVLALTETAVPASWIEGTGIEYRQVPVKNHTAPNMTQLDECVDFIDTNIRKGKKTLVHCAAGKGRTGTVIAAYLCAHEDLSAEDAIRRVRSKRKGSIEVDAKVGQEEAVIEYCKYIRSRKSDKTV